MIVLVGFMGAGKSTAAREIAMALGRRAVDADTLLARRLGGPIDAYFAEHGERAFREREEELVLELLGSGEEVVLALGGGAVESPRTRAALRDHLTILLEVDADTAWARCRDTPRPLARDRDAFGALLERRRPLYEEVARWILPARRGIAARAVRTLPAGDARVVWALTASGDYPVVVGRAVRDLDVGAPGRGFVVTDERVGPHWAPGADIVVPAGEAAKTVEVAAGVWRDLVRLGVTRGDHVRAVGGGCVTDLAGFCAATYQRGVPIVQVPTTLLAMVDAAIGGKTAVNLPEAKNYVGAYHQPVAVLADTETLSTLPEAEAAEGYAEVVKTALIAGGPLWDRVADGAEVDDEIVFACARTKTAVVAADERDSGVRQILNLGHTTAHALEIVLGSGRLTHGSAVGLGLLAALRLSGQGELRERVAALLAARGLPTQVDADVDAVLEVMRRDKKRTGEHLPFVLVAAPGDVSHGHAVGDAAARAAVAELLR